MRKIAVRLRARPVGMPQASDWDIREEEAAAPDEGEVLIAVRYVSVSPSIRNQMEAGGAYLPPLAIGDVARARAVGEVLESRSPAFAPGDHVEGLLGTQSHFTGSAAGLMKVDPNVAPLERYLGALGMTGFTAYFGMLDIGRPVSGETVVVSGAAGAVGSIAGQIARLKGCRVVGIAGGPAKCAHVVDDLGFDDCIDHLDERMGERLGEAAPRGVDIYFDNVGGKVLDEVLLHLALRARIPICGGIAHYNSIGAVGLKNHLKLLEMRGRMEGFSIYDYPTRHLEARDALAGWLADGSIVTREHIEDGLDRFPEALKLLFGGAQLGKLMVKV
ncbi:MAG: NADP-dependent oxidoreductase [Alphaproteobacteria bacterium]|nr:NADP-dependent oxidoreductase [Alphaproteobacteria bacterium]MBU1515215.1 NADP-dependent oxidoreductase [Alphaproteobacteria bacterium]MBU2092345.1 NADP-dependent oxidoreductase [Alphaproteobacteria bacterium]MBU2152939.1 NADP-dependent oxidoreductase [Alphaproteobacteria bacterium]MBU2305770.1 NADP-dependent oxidoreductase [Alphaproteobacteria bacterium]